MEKAYEKINYENKPSTATPLGATNLNKMDSAIDLIDNRVVALSEDIEELSELGDDLDKKVDDLTDLSNIVTQQVTLLDGRVTEAESDITENAENITILENRFTGFSVAMSQGMELLFDKADEAEAKIEKNTEDINALKIIPTASGTTAYIDDASNMNLENIIFYGESKQMQTTGAQLVDIADFELVKPDTRVKTFSIDTIEAGSYNLNVKLKGTATRVRVRFVGVDNTNCKDVELKDGNTVLTCDRQVNKLYFFIVQEETDGVTASISDVMLSVEPLPYEKYTGRKASPSPDYPQPIESKTVNRVDVYGKNLLKFSQGSTTSNGITFTVNADKSVTVNGTATADAVLLLTTSTREEVDLKRLTGKSIILSGCPSGGSGTTYKFQFWSASKWAVDTGNGATLDLSTVPDTWNFAISIISGTTINNLTFYPMIRLPEFTDGTYEPYQSQTKILATGTYRLDGIGDLKNYYDAKRGVFGEKVDRVTFDGSDDEAWSFGTTNNGRRMQINIPVKPVSNVNVKGNVLCNRYIVTTAGENYMEKQGIAVDTSSRLYVYDANFKSSLISDWKAYLQANPMTVVYEVAEPEEGNLISSVKDDFAEFLKLHTYKPNTVVMNGADAEMDVHYVADAKTYIDKKFEALAKAIVNQ